MVSDFFEAIASAPLLLDAAMGTRLIARGLDLTRDDPCLWNLSRPEDVLAVHRLDLDAGSDALYTNTFGANRGRLERLGRVKDLLTIHRAAVALAREAARPSRFVVGCVGPSDWPLEQVDALLEADVDAIVLETYSAPDVDRVLPLVRERTGLPVFLSLHRWPDDPGESARRWADLGASALGTNCQVGMKPMLATARALRGATELPLLIKPSAGLPGEPTETPESLASAVPELLALGVRLFGGCCGTTEAHIEAMRVALGHRP